MQPIGNAWNKLPRIVRDLAVETGKKIELTMHGAETELDRQVLEMIKDPLTHMVRNSADHGIERRPRAWPPASRRPAPSPWTPITKAATSSSASPTTAAAWMSSASARRRSPTAWRPKPRSPAMSDQQILQFIFRAGFSTAEKVTSVSGRGVGMDVVRTNIERIGGTIELTSVAGRGTTFLIKIPLTLAIVSALIVEVSGQRFAIPQLNVIELVSVSDRSEARIETINTSPVLRLRDRLLPLVSLRGVCSGSTKGTSSERNDFVIVAQVGATTFGIIVDRVFDTEEIVVKPVAPILRHTDIFYRQHHPGRRQRHHDPGPQRHRQGARRLPAVPPTRSPRRTRRSRASAAEQLTSLLVFRAGSSQPKAVPLGLVTRLEELATDKIELSNGRHMVQYRDQLMPLVQMNGVSVQTSGVTADPGVRRRRPLDGSGGRRDHRHRRGAPPHRGRGPRRGHSRLRRHQGAGHRSDRCRPLPADGVLRLVHPQGDASLGYPRNRCCWSTTARSSATCWRRS